MAQTSKSFRHLGSGWKPGPRLWKYLKNQLGQDSQFFCGNLGDVRVTEAEMRFHHLGGELTQPVVPRHVLDFWGSQLWNAKIPSGSHLTEMLALICSAFPR
jgi:hypothetical protein